MKIIKWLNNIIILTLSFMNRPNLLQKGILTFQPVSQNKYIFQYFNSLFIVDTGKKEALYGHRRKIFE